MVNEPLPGMPEPPVVVKRPPPVGLRISRYTLKKKRLCDTCIDLIHRWGMLRAPFPRAVRWKADDPKGRRYLCEQHKDEIT